MRGTATSSTYRVCTSYRIVGVYSDSVQDPRCTVLCIRAKDTRMRAESMEYVRQTRVVDHGSATLHPPPSTLFDLKASNPPQDRSIFGALTDNGLSFFLSRWKIGS